MMLLPWSLGVLVGSDSRLARFAAGAAAATPGGRADVPHLKHKTGSPFLSFNRYGSRSSN